MRTISPPDTKRLDASNIKKALNLMNLKSLDKESLGNLLQCLIGADLGKWDLILSIARIAYHSLVNKSIGMSSFEVRGYKPRKPINLIPMTHHLRIFESVFAFASHVHDLHKEINKKI